MSIYELAFMLRILIFRFSNAWKIGWRQARRETVHNVAEVHGYIQRDSMLPCMLHVFKMLLFCCIPR